MHWPRGQKVKGQGHTVTKTVTFARLPVTMASIPHPNTWVCMSIRLHVFSRHPRESEGICFHRRWFVCLCMCPTVTMITKKIMYGFAPNFMRRFLRGKGRPSSCLVTIGRGMWKSRSKKLRKPAIVYKIAPSGKSKLAGRKITGVASVAKCWRQKRFRWDLYSLGVLSN